MRKKSYIYIYIHVCVYYILKSIYLFICRLMPTRGQVVLVELEQGEHMWKYSPTCIWLLYMYTV